MKTVRICCGTGCLANGSAKVADEFERLLSQGGFDATVECDIKRTGCNGDYSKL
jgi:NADH-quinone oxidoreductase subunit F